jgi:dTDP-glucose pyrophosphorylase
MVGIYPCAGHGTRIAEIAQGEPKALLEFDGKPILYYNIAPYDEYLEKIVLVIREDQEEAFNMAVAENDFLGKFLDRILFVRQDSQRGMGHAVLTAMEHMPTKWLENGVVIVSPDTYMQGSLVRDLRRPGDVMAVMAVSEEELEMFGRRSEVYLMPGEWTVREVREKHPLDAPFLIPGYSWAGWYHTWHGAELLETLRILNGVEAYINGELYVTTAMQGMISRGLPITAHPLETVIDIGTPEGYRALKEHFNEDDQPG